MTLLELLVKELPKRGGWPDNAVQSWQSLVDGEIYFDSSCGKRVGYRNGDIYLPIVGNGLDEVITRDQYEAAIEAQQPAWNGEGLPTTGVKCEWQDYNTKKWIPVRVVYSSEWVTIISEDKDDDAIELAIENYGDKGRRKFRTVRTEADSKRDEVINAIALAYDKQDNSGNYRAATGVYEDIAAGKIPGIELSK